MYDLVIIGGGPAGYRAAELAARAGLQVLLAERRWIGGTCLNEGCIPTKTLLHAAKIRDNLATANTFGVSGTASLDAAKVQAYKDRVVRTLAAGIRSALKQAGVEVRMEEARIQKGGACFQVQVGEELVASKRLLLATGSKTFIPRISGLEEGRTRGLVLTSREMLQLKEVPKQFVVLGGGVIGLELASYFNSLGSQVTVLEMLGQIGGGGLDPEIAGILKNNYAKKGVAFALEAQVRAIGDGEVVWEQQGETKSCSADCILLAAGRQPATQGLGLDVLGWPQDKPLETDEHMLTQIPGLYAAGDVNGKSMLAHTAYREAEVAVNHMLEKEDAMTYGSIPAVLYTNPEVATVGETQTSAREKGWDAKEVTLSMRYSGRYMAENPRGDGILKLVAEVGTGRLLGVHMIANYASEIICAAAVLLEQGATVKDLKRTVFPHPTVSEVLREAAFLF